MAEQSLHSVCPHVTGSFRRPAVTVLYFLENLPDHQLSEKFERLFKNIVFVFSECAPTECGGEGLEF